MIPYHTHQPFKFFLLVVCWLVVIVFGLQCVYSPSAAYMRQWTELGLVQVMACRRFRHQAMLAYCQVDSWEQISVTFEADSIIFITIIHLELSSIKLAVMLSRGKWVTWMSRHRHMWSYYNCLSGLFNSAWESTQHTAFAFPQIVS